MMAVLMYPFATRMPSWGYKGPALVAPKPGEMSVRPPRKEEGAVAPEVADDEEAPAAAPAEL